MLDEIACSRTAGGSSAGCANFDDNDDNDDDDDTSWR